MSPVLTGPDATRKFAALQNIDRAQERRREWPYVHLYSTPDSETVHGSDIGIQAVAVPAPGSVTAVSYLVPNGHRFYMSGILLDFEGTFTPGDTLWTVTENPNNSKMSNPVQGLVNIPVPLGSWREGVIWPFHRPYEFASLTLLAAVATNVNLSAGPPNQYVSGFFGWLEPGM